MRERSSWRSSTATTCGSPTPFACWSRRWIGTPDTSRPTASRCASTPRVGASSATTLREIKRRRLAWSAGGTVPIDATAPTEFGSFLLENWCVSPGTSLIRRDALERVGPFDRAVAPADDWDLNIRLSRLGPFGFVDRPVLEWRRHDATLTNTSSRWRDSYLATLAKSVWDPANTADQRRLASSCFRHGRAEAARDTLDLVLAGRGRDAGSSAVHAVLGWWHHVRAARRRRGRTDSVPSERRP